MKTREELPRWLTDDYLNHVDLIEPYRRGQGKILAADDDCVYLRIDDISLAAVRNAAGLKRVLNAVPKGDILSIVGYTEAGVCEAVGTGAYISRRLAKDEPREAVRYAIAAAVTTIEQDAVRRRSLKDADIRKSIYGMRIEERKIA